MEWSQFKQLVLRHALHPGSIQFIQQQGSGITDRVSIFDLNLPKRERMNSDPLDGVLRTQHSVYEDTMAAAFCCNATYDNGEIPRHSPENGRGYVDVLGVLLLNGSIRPSKELDAIINKPSINEVPNWMRTHYES